MWADDAAMERSKHRIVILVLANKPAALRGLLRLLDERFRIIIHLDAKTDATDIELPAHASFTAVRLPIFWGWLQYHAGGSRDAR